MRRDEEQDGEHVESRVVDLDARLATVPMTIPSEARPAAGMEGYRWLTSMTKALRPSNRPPP